MSYEEVLAKPRFQAYQHYSYLTKLRQYRRRVRAFLITPIYKICLKFVQKHHRFIQKQKYKQTRGYTSDYDWQVLRLAVFKRDNFVCQICANPVSFYSYKNDGTEYVPSDQAEVDHIKRASRGGTSDISNLRTVCRHCHDYKDVRYKTGMPVPKKK